MKQFLIIILRNQFNLFYRFGYTFIPKSQLIEFEGVINNETRKRIIKQFKTVTPFEYDEEYLILHLEKETFNESDFIQFEVQDIIAVYPLSLQAKISIESKIDQRIRIENPIFETILPLIESEIENNEVKKAVSALWKICNIESPLEKHITNIGLENIFKGLEFRKQGTKANKIPKGNYWEYLIAYDRFDYFPNSTLGYFYDAGQVFAYSKGLSTFEGSGIHNFLEKLNSQNPASKFPDIIRYLETVEQLKGYVTQTTTNEIKQYIVAPLYLMLRDEIRKSEGLTKTKLFKNLDYLKTFGDTFNYVVILLGAFFGFRKFYDNYYEVLNLRFYKDFKPIQKQTPKVNVLTGVEKSTKTGTEKEEHGKQTETKDKEIITESSSVKELIIDDGVEISRKEKQPEINVKEQNENKEIISETTSQYQKIIEEELTYKGEIRYVDIVKLIKKKSGDNIDKNDAVKITKGMSNVEETKIGDVKKPNGIKQKEKTATLFS